MITPVATVIFAIAMALSLSVEADSFFHTGSPSATPNAEAAEHEALAEGETATAVAADGSVAET
ncbi:hypothetical protein [Paraliomyxa miuraensis]|uniref:hypothetical protein n=1 Tax=Paraliomyxa miuraensis TaxID=376150 RepID=UPI00225B7020|nr:hypothetical protein [Paraliomyxa miuraensis]MCX4247634.1 hypothetical protein [Paraliomyxa miuraensis]